ncbi:MAG: hypothetical protein LBU32_17265 [Clostridiales bacterium]|nr:hypothetical protein [Clostridiales bacterium]
MADRIITTVLGDIKEDRLGVASMQDHIMYDGRAEALRLRKNLPQSKLPIGENDKVSLENVGILHRNAMLAWDAFLQADESAMEREVSLFKKAGGDSILDVSVIGNRIGTCAGISRKTGVNVIASTGFSSSDSWPESLLGLEIGDFLGIMLREIEEGIEGSTVKPGHLHIDMAVYGGDEEKALRAAARAQALTGLSLSVSPADFSKSPEILNIIKEEGASLSRVLIGSATFARKPSFARVIRHPQEYGVCIESAKAVLDAGANIAKPFENTMGFELAGDYDAGDWAEMSGLAALVNQGYARQIVLGNNCRGAIMLHNSGGEGFCRLMYYSIPMLRNAAGISDYAIRQMTELNPARILSRALN